VIFKRSSKVELEMCRSILLLIPGVLGSASDVYGMPGCVHKDADTCECGMPGLSPTGSGSMTTVTMNESYCDEMIANGTATAFVTDDTCKGKCMTGGTTDYIGCYGTDGAYQPSKGHGVCACHITEARCVEMVADGQATMWSHKCGRGGVSSCAPYTSGCYGTDGENKGHGVCACSMPGAWSDHTKSYSKIGMTEEKCDEMVAAGNATMFTHLCDGMCAETLGCYGTDGVNKGHGVCACTVTETQCAAMVAAGNATMWSYSCAGMCADLPDETTEAPATTETTDSASNGTQVVSASLTITGLTEADAKSMEADIKKGIADSIEGVSATDVTITEYTSTTATGRRLQDTLVVKFTVAIPDGSTAATISNAVDTALADKATVLTNIKAAAEASGSTVDLSAVEITASTAAAVVDVAEDDVMGSGASLVLFGALSMIYS
jgi:hypothetical protein